MSHKIKIDLCELFGVKEGQEFRFVDYCQKYKIENGILYSYSDYTLDWFKTNFTLSNIKTEFEIEILKPETPPEIKKILQAFYDMGFEYFAKNFDGFTFWNIGKNGKAYVYIENFYTKAFAQWVETTKPLGEYKIKDYI